MSKRLWNLPGLLLLGLLAGCGTIQKQIEHKLPDGTTHVDQFSQVVSPFGHNMSVTRQSECRKGMTEPTDENPDGMLCATGFSSHHDSPSTLPALAGVVGQTVVGVRQAQATEEAAGNIRPDEMNINQSGGGATIGDVNATAEGGDANAEAGAVAGAVANSAAIAQGTNAHRPPRRDPPQNQPPKKKKKRTPGPTINQNGSAGGCAFTNWC